MRAQEFVTKTVPAQKVLQYVKQAHAPDEFNIEYSITDHPEWQLTNIPVSQLKLDPDGEQQDPYRRVNWVDYDTVAELVPRIESILKSMPIVVDANGWIIDGNHRAAAAAAAGMTSVPAYVPAQDKLSENFADGKVKGKSRPGRVKRAGASCNGSVTDLRARAKKASGEKAKMYHWCANMKSGRNKNK
jgi:ParB-like nuclease domain